jgi:CRISPR-associated protein Csx14
MGMMLASAATLLCDHQDRLWHMYTPAEQRSRADSGAVMHLPPESGMTLIPVPMAPWGAYFPALRAMAQAPQEAVATQMSRLRGDDERRCRQVIERITRRQHQTLAAFACGLRPQEVAAKLQVTLSTVNAHKSAILAECRIAWEIPEGQRLDFHFLAQHFAHLDTVPQ